jgi:predicted nucleic acid-binding protein
LLEADRRYLHEVKEIFTKVEKGELSADTSIVTPLEVLSAPALQSDSSKTRAIERFFQKLPNLTIHPLNWEIMAEAAHLRRQNPTLRTPDSIQLATAELSGAKHFLTNDLKLQKISGCGVKVVTISSSRKIGQA